jgi:glycine/D-amino acid oxidase-like deaminating enzyme
MSEKIPMERHNYDVVVIGAGGAGLRAAVEAREAGLRVAIICKSLFGKAHTVMAEGGIAASMGNVNEFGSLSYGAPSLIELVKERFHNVTLVDMSIHVLLTLVIAPALN